MGISELKEIAEALEKLSNIKDLDIDIQINIKKQATTLHYYQYSLD